MQQLFFPLSNIETLFNNIQFQATTTFYTLFTFFCETRIGLVKFGFAWICIKGETREFALQNVPIFVIEAQINIVFGR
jgi:hypothetical protein